MSLHVVMTKATMSKLRKLPFLPRFAIAVEIAGRQLTLRSTPTLETILNVRDLGLSLANWRRVVEQEIAEIRLPGISKSAALAKKGLAQVQSIKDKVGVKPTPINKAALKKRAKSGSTSSV